MPKVKAYEVCEYTNKSLGVSIMNQQATREILKNRQFTVIKTFTDLEEARKMLEKDRDRKTQQTPYVLRYVFEEIKSDEPIH